MTTERITELTAKRGGEGTKRSWLAPVSVIVGVFLLTLIAINARSGAVSPRIRNPQVQGAPRPVEPLFGYQHWLVVFQIWAIVFVVIMVPVYVWAWRKYGPHPILLMGLVVTMLIWQDPIMNWAPYAVYDPRLWHFPEDWPLVSLSPTVEPFVVIGYANLYFGPYFAAIWILRKIQARRPVDSFVWRHPLISLALIILAIGIPFDGLIEGSMVRTGFYIYSQVIPFGSIFVGQTYQFPFIWETVLVNLVMVPAGVLLYRDDTGRTVAEKLAQRVHIFPSKPALGMFVVMFAILNVTYLAYGAGYAIIRTSRLATSVACPWPYPEAKVYDPQGFYEQNGQPGPYSVGIWSTWMSAQPDGRPSVTLGSVSDRCAEKHGG